MKNFITLSITCLIFNLFVNAQNSFPFYPTMSDIQSCSNMLTQPLNGNVPCVNEDLDYDGKTDWNIGFHDDFKACQIDMDRWYLGDQSNAPTNRTHWQNQAGLIECRQKQVYRSK